MAWRSAVPHCGAGERPGGRRARDERAEADRSKGGITDVRTYLRTYVFCRCVSAPNLLLSLLHPTPWRTYVFSYVTPPTVNLRTKGECCPGNGPRARPGPGEGDIVGGAQGESVPSACALSNARFFIFFMVSSRFARKIRKQWHFFIAA